MTMGGDFAPAGELRENEPKYPVVFGIALTPKVSGILLALLGVAGAAYLLLNVVQPTWQRTAELEQDVATKEQQLENQGKVREQIEQARTQLRDAQKLQADVLALFATEPSLDTLLIDLNERVQAANARIADPEQRATLSRFELVPVPPPTADGQPGDLVTDGSFGTAVNGKLRQRIYNVEMQGSFAQVQSIIRNIERLQPLLVVRNLRSEPLRPPTLTLDQQGRVIGNQSDPRLKVSFQMVALLPASTPAATNGTAPAAAPAPAVSPAPSP